MQIARINKRIQIAEDTMNKRFEKFFHSLSQEEKAKFLVAMIGRYNSNLILDLPTNIEERMQAITEIVYANTQTIEHMFTIWKEWK